MSGIQSCVNYQNHFQDKKVQHFCVSHGVPVMRVSGVDDKIDRKSIFASTPEPDQTRDAITNIKQRFHIIHSQISGTLKLTGFARVAVRN